MGAAPEPLRVGSGDTLDDYISIAYIMKFVICNW